MQVKKYTVSRFTHSGDRLCTYTAHEYYTQKQHGLQLVLKVKKTLRLYTFNDNVCYDNESNTVLTIERVHVNLKTLSDSDIRKHRGIHTYLLGKENDGTYDKFYVCGIDKDKNLLEPFLSNGDDDFIAPKNKFLLKALVASLDVNWSNVMNFTEDDFVDLKTYNSVLEKYIKFINFKNYFLMNTEENVFAEILDVVNKKNEAVKNRDYEKVAEYRQQELTLRQKIWK